MISTTYNQPSPFPHQQKTSKPSDKTFTTINKLNSLNQNNNNSNCNSGNLSGQSQVQQSCSTSSCQLTFNRTPTSTVASSNFKTSNAKSHHNSTFRNTSQSTTSTTASTTEQQRNHHPQFPSNTCGNSQTNNNTNNVFCRQNNFNDNLNYVKSEIMGRTSNNNRLHSAENSDKKSTDLKESKTFFLLIL